MFISRELWLDFCKCSFCKTWQDSCGFALFARPLFCLKDRTEAGKGNSGLAEAQRVVEETANGSRRNDRKQRESRYGEHTRCYHISKYTSRFSYFLGVRTRMCWGAFERGGRSIGWLTFAPVFLPFEHRRVGHLPHHITSGSVSVLTASMSQGSSISYAFNTRPCSTLSASTIGF